MIDLHAHTTASDGRLSPSELVRRAAEAGVTHLAITDHDTVAGIAEARAAASGVTIVPGIEVSTRLATKDLHVLGHFVDPEHPALRAFAAAQLRERRARMERMVENLRRLNIAVELREVEAVAGSDNLCRPHLARVLVQKNVVRDVQDAFSKYLGDGRPGYAPHRTPSAGEAIALIHEAGGVASLAHPQVDGVDRADLEQLRALGLDGLEVFRPDQAAPLHHKWLELARALELLPTGGSDFHGEPTQLGCEAYDDSAFALWQARAER
jgi:predicted metal-dependent phosphoesterase TrpH